MSKHPLALCELCPLFAERGPALGAFGPEHVEGTPAKYLIVGEAPGSEEARAGRPFVGPSGQLLDAVLTAVDVLPSETYRTNVVLCRPPGNSTPPDKALSCCRPRLLAELNEHPTAVLIATGGEAARALGLATGILKSRGKWAKSEALGYRPYMPTLHPAFVLRNPPSIRELILDFEKAKLPVPDPIPDFEPFILELPNDSGHLKFGPHVDEVVFDVETDANGRLLSINLAWGATLDQTSVIVAPTGRWDCVGQALNQPNIQYIAHNGKFDVNVLRRNGIEARCDFDTMLANYALDERKGGSNQYGQFNIGVHGLKVLAGYYFDAPNYDAEIDTHAKRGGGYDMARVPPELLYRYGVLDAHYTYRLKHLLAAQLRAEGIEDWPFRGLLMPASDAFTLVEERGFRIDTQLLHRLRNAWAHQLELNWNKMERLCGHEFNPRSPIQVAKVLYDEFKLPPPPVRKGIGTSFKAGTNRSTDKTALVLNQDAPGKGGEFVRAMLFQRRLEKLLGSYVEAIDDRLWPDGRIRTSVKIHGTETGRVSSEDPALLNLPRADDKEDGQYGKSIRDLFIASEGMGLVAVDLSQAEMRIVAALSGEPTLVTAFREGRDPHGSVAVAVFGEGSGEEERYVAKAINFGFLYGGGRNVLIDRVMDLRGFRPSMKPSKEAVGKIIDDYMARMARLGEWREEQLRFVKEHGFVETRTGRRRRFRFINDTNADEVRKACVNSPVQGLASDINLLAFIDLTKQGYRTLLTVHDSIILEAPLGEIETVAKYVQQRLLEEWNKWVPEVPGDADVKVGERWGSLTKLKLS